MDDIFKEIVEKQQSHIDNLEKQVEHQDKQISTAIAGHKLFHKKQFEKWELLQKWQQTVTCELEQVWNIETECTIKRDNLKTNVDKLKEKLTSLNESVKSSEASQKALASAVELANRESLDLAKTLLVTNPKEKYMDQLLTNITRVKWSHSSDEQGGVVKGTVLSTSQQAKKFHVNPEQKSPEVICSELWSLLTEGETFLT